MSAVAVSSYSASSSASASASTSAPPSSTGELTLRGSPKPRLFQAAGSTLEDVILGAWEDLAVEGRAECPVCRERLAPAGCSSCGSALS